MCVCWEMYIGLWLFELVDISVDLYFGVEYGEVLSFVVLFVFERLLLIEWVAYILWEVFDYLYDELVVMFETMVLVVW